MLWLQFEGKKEKTVKKCSRKQVNWFKFYCKLNLRITKKLRHFLNVKD